MPDLSREDLLRLIDAIPHLVWTTDAAGVPTYLNQRWKTFAGADLDATARGGASAFVHPDDLENYRALAVAGRGSHLPFEMTIRFRRADGAYRRHVIRLVPLTPGEPGAWAASAMDVEDAYRFEQEQQFLIEAGKRLAASLDTKTTLDHVAELLVPRLADWFAVDLLREDGIAERVSMVHVDPAKVERAWEFTKRMPPQPDSPAGIYQVMRTRQPEVNAEIPDELLAQSIPDPVTLELIRSLGLRSSMCVPLVAGDTVVGALTLVSAESQRRYEARDLSFALSLAGLIGMALHNARLFESAERARVASEAVAADVIEQSRAAQELIVAMRRERDEALAKLAGR